MSLHTCAHVQEVSVQGYVCVCVCPYAPAACVSACAGGVCTGVPMSLCVCVPAHVYLCPCTRYAHVWALCVCAPMSTYPCTCVFMCAHVQGVSGCLHTGARVSVCPCAWGAVPACAQAPGNGVRWYMRAAGTTPLYTWLWFIRLLLPVRVFVMVLSDKVGRRGNLSCDC